MEGLFTRIGRWLLAMGLALGFAGPQGCWAGPQGQPGFELQTWTQAQRVGPDGGSPRQVSLPDLASSNGIGLATWTYRLPFDRERMVAVGKGPHPAAGDPATAAGNSAAPAEDSDAPLLGLRLPRACGNLTVRINGTVVHEDRDADAGRTEGCRRSQLVAIPWALTQAGPNLIEVSLQGWSRDWVSTATHATGLAPPSLGLHANGLDQHQWDAVFSVEIPAVLVGGLLMLTALTGTLWFFAPRERHLGDFAGVCAAWSLLMLHDQWNIPVHTAWLRDGIPTLLLAAAACLHVRFICAYGDLEGPGLRRLAAWQLLAAPLVLVASGTPQLFAAASIGSVAAALLVAVATLMFVRRTDAPRRRPMKAMSATLTLGLAIVGLELATNLGWMFGQNLTPLQWGVPLCLVLMGGLQLSHFGRQVHQLEGAQRSLEHKIELARSEIESNFAQLAEARIQQVTAGERKRIAADLHDDLGAKLLTIVHTSRSDRIAALAREALDEMRLSVRGLTGRPMELSEALADWRTEAISRLSATGIEVDWPLPQEDMPQVLGSRTMVQTTRILREVFNNLIRHSHAVRCEVSTQVGADRLSIEIRDNGIGFDTERMRQGSQGLGLLSMAHRARQLQGDCVIESRLGGGSRVKLSLPLDVTAA